jgi:hypothetical protein
MKKGARHDVFLVSRQKGEWVTAYISDYPHQHLQKPPLLIVKIPQEFSRLHSR